MDKPFQLTSKFDWDEKVVAAVGALIAPVQAIRFTIPQSLVNRSVYLFLEAVPTLATEDFELEAVVEFYRNNGMVYSFPASVASNALNAGVVLKSKITAFGNVVAGQNEGLSVTFSAPQANGSFAAVLTPQKLTLDADEVVLKITGSKNTGNSFASWRALLAVRSLA